MIFLAETFRFNCFTLLNVNDLLVSQHFSRLRVRPFCKTKVFDIGISYKNRIHFVQLSNLTAGFSIFLACFHMFLHENICFLAMQNFNWFALFWLDGKYSAPHGAQNIYPKNMSAQKHLEKRHFKNVILIFKWQERKRKSWLSVS